MVAHVPSALSKFPIPHKFVDTVWIPAPAFNVPDPAPHTPSSELNPLAPLLENLAAVIPDVLLNRHVPEYV